MFEARSWALDLFSLGKRNDEVKEAFSLLIGSGTNFPTEVLLAVVGEQ